MESFKKVPELFAYYRNGKVGKKVYPVTITMNVKNPQYRAINCPNEFKSLLNSFLELKKYRYLLNGVLEYHKPDGKFRKGGLHLHGFVYNRNPPRDNIDNLFHFYIQQPDELKGVTGYVKYCKKAIDDTEKEFKRLSALQAEPITIFDSPTIRVTNCLFDD